MHCTRREHLYRHIGIFGSLLIPFTTYASHELIINTLVNKILRPGANVLLVLATVFFMVGLVEYIAGASNETARTTGRNHILWGTVGLAIMISVSFILRVLSSVFYPTV